MKMPPTAALVLLQCIFLMDSSVADPLIDVSPSEINIGITSTLDINCTFSLSDHPDLPAVISLVLSRATATGENFEDLATITEFSPNSVTLLTQETLSATGVHSQTGESFLQLTWEYPTILQAGVYKCSAIGVGMMGDNVEMTNTSLVTVNKADLSMSEKLQQLEMQAASLQQQILTVQNDKISLEKHVADLESNNSYLEGALASLPCVHSPVDYLGSHGTKDYYISSNAFLNVNQSIGFCKALGGQLAVIDDEDEFNAIKEFLDGTSGIYFVIIAGTDEQTEGTWVLPESDTPMPFTRWGPGCPHFGQRRINCVMLHFSISWSMVDDQCNIDQPSNKIRFICEI